MDFQIARAPAARILHSIVADVNRWRTSHAEVERPEENALNGGLAAVRRALSQVLLLAVSFLDLLAKR
jgi:hypothetical protein